MACPVPRPGRCGLSAAGPAGVAERSRDMHRLTRCRDDAWARIASGSKPQH
jgi:hypothetical protein